MLAMDILRKKKRNLSGSESDNKKKLKDGLDSADDVFNSSDSSFSSEEGQGSSNEDHHMISRRQQMLARRTTRRDKQRELLQLKRKDKNKISMEDFLSKQTEFNMWLEEEKDKNYKDMSSPKRKVFFRTFLKLWNKRKLPQKYYRGSTVEVASPTPVQRVNLFEDPPEHAQLTAIKRPKSKRLSIEQAGFFDSPFSTFGKTPPKLLHHTSLDKLEGKENATPTISTAPSKVEIPGNSQVSPILELGEYQIPMNSVRVGSKIQSYDNRTAVPYSVTSYPWTDSDTSSLKSDITDEEDQTISHTTFSNTAVYALPMKSKHGHGQTKSRGHGHNFQPPPVPPKPKGGFNNASLDINGYKSIITPDNEFLPPPPIVGEFMNKETTEDNLPPPPSSEDILTISGSKGFPSPPLQFKDKVKPPSPCKPARSPHTKLMSCNSVKSYTMKTVQLDSMSVDSGIVEDRPRSMDSAERLDQQFLNQEFEVGCLKMESKLDPPFYSRDTGVNRNSVQTGICDLYTKLETVSKRNISQQLPDSGEQLTQNTPGRNHCSKVRSVQDFKAGKPRYVEGKLLSEYAELDDIRLESVEKNEMHVQSQKILQDNIRKNQGNTTGMIKREDRKIRVTDNQVKPSKPKTFAEFKNSLRSVSQSVKGRQKGRLQIKTESKTPQQQEKTEPKTPNTTPSKGIPPTYCTPTFAKPQTMRFQELLLRKKGGSTSDTGNSENQDLNQIQKKTCAVKSTIDTRGQTRRGQIGSSEKSKTSHLLREIKPNSFNNAKKGSYNSCKNQQQRGLHSAGNYQDMVQEGEEGGQQDTETVIW